MQRDGFHEEVEVARVPFTVVVAPCGDQYLGRWQCGRCGAKGFTNCKFRSIEDAIKGNIANLSAHCCSAVGEP
jgi:hypothetical protein